MPEDPASRIESLEAEKRRLQVMLASSADFIARITVDGRFLYVNHVAQGHEIASVIGTSVYDYIPAAFHERAQRAIKTAHETRSVQEYRTIGPVSTERNGHYLTRVSPVIESGEVTSLVMTATNITVLEEQRLLLQLALEAVGLGTFSFDPATGEGSWDDMAASVFGLAPGTPMPGMTRFFAEYLHPDDHELASKAFEQTLADARFGPIEYRVRLASGSTRWVSAAGTTMRDPKGAIIAIVGTLKDVTERRALEARLRDAEKLESIGRLAGGVAHDFNNMLTAILGNVAFAAGVESLEEMRPLLDEVRVAAERSAALTAQLLAFARRQLVEPKIIAPDELIQRLEPLLRRLLDERNKLELKLGASSHVRIGESQLEQVVMNLVTNARDSLAGMGHITVETRDVTLSAATSTEAGLAPGDYLLLAVSDTGRGIPADVRPHLFEPFFTTREGGTGLGLATCYGIVTQNGGSISVESELAEGSTFRVFLPRVAAGTSAGASPTSLRRPTTRINVLVVEDEDSVRRVIEHALRGEDFVVSVASGAEEARRLAAAHAPFDVLVTDIVMPEVDGHELARGLRERWPELAVLFISGYTQEMPLNEHGSDPTVAFLQKPFRPSDLSNAVHQLLGASVSARRQAR
ncbi:MAG TPA: ATP-binding protein [Polyangiaceae bacterium]|nr:ATP-binding protein [Polyangiaceae bacterium]